MKSAKRIELDVKLAHASDLEWACSASAPADLDYMYYLTVCTCRHLLGIYRNCLSCRLTLSCISMEDVTPRNELVRSRRSYFTNPTHLSLSISPAATKCEMVIREDTFLNFQLRINHLSSTQICMVKKGETI